MLGYESQRVQLSRYKYNAPSFHICVVSIRLKLTHKQLLQVGYFLPNEVITSDTVSLASFGFMFFLLVLLKFPFSFLMN